MCNHQNKAVTAINKTNIVSTCIKGGKRNSITVWFYQ